MQFDLVVKNGKIVTHTGIFDGTIAVKDGKIAAVVGPTVELDAGKVIDAKGLYVMPGCIDPHSHLSIYQPMKEDMPAVTGACAGGGTTTLASFIMDTRPLAQSWHDWRDPIDVGAYIDIFFHLCIMDEIHLSEMEKAVENGIASFKFMMGYVGKAGRQINITGATSEICAAGFSNCAKWGAKPLCHAEHVEICYPFEDQFKGETIEVLQKIRPRQAEHIDIFQCCCLAEMNNLPVYFVHQTTKESIGIVAPFRARGVDVHLETCPHYLVTDHHGTGLKEPKLLKISPPVREPEDAVALWKGLEEGTIQHMGTDSCRNMHEQKIGDGKMWGDTSILLDWCAIELMLPLLISEGYHKGKLTLPQIVKATSYENAKFFDLTQKGAIELGKDADLVIVDVNKKKHITPEVMHDNQDWNLYEGWDVTGWPVTTLVRGEVVFDDDKVVGKPGYGKYIPRKPKK